jgi:oxidoreductase
MTPQPHPARRPLRLAINGCGWVVQHCYRPALQQLAGHVDVVAACDPDAQARDFAARAWPNVRICDRRDDLLVARPDAVLVASPNASHVDDGVAMLAAGLSCLIEKPAVRGIRDAERLTAARRAGAALASGVASRFRADTRLWLAHVEELGPVDELDLLWTRQHGVPAAPWHLRDSDGWTGVFADLGYHLLDIAGAALRWPDDAVEVLQVERSSQGRAEAAEWYGGAQTVAYDIDDRFAFMVSIAGCRLSIRVNWIDETPGDLVRLRARGPGGEALLEGLFGFSRNRRCADQRVVLGRDGQPPRETRFAPGAALQVAGFEALLRSFRDAITAPVETDGAELTFVARVADAVRARSR